MMGTKIYIAGSYAGRARIRAEASRLAAIGNTVILSRWFNDDDFIERAWDKNYAGRVAETMAMSDLHAILEADMVVLDTFEPSTSGGRCVELGAALMRSLDRKVRVVHIGPPTNIFETLVREHYASWDDFLLAYEREVSSAKS